MLDKEPTLLEIEKIFSTAMIEEGEDWKTKMEKAETILEKKMDRVTAGIALRRYSDTLRADTEVDLCVNGEDGTEVHFLRMPLTSSKK